MQVQGYGYALLKRCCCKVWNIVHKLQLSSLPQLSTACKLEVNCDKDVSRARYVPSARATGPSLNPRVLHGRVLIIGMLWFLEPYLIK